MPPSLSWSGYSLWKRSHAEWYDKYILGKPSTANKSKLVNLGKRVADSFLTNEPLVPFRRLLYVEPHLEADYEDIHLHGYLDTFCGEDHIEYTGTAIFGEFKTGMYQDIFGHIGWHQRKAEEHGQLRFYSLLILLKYGVIPEKQTIYLQWKPVVMKDWDFVLSDLPVQTFDVTLTTEDVGKFGKQLVRAWKSMAKYVEERAELSTSEVA